MTIDVEALGTQMLEGVKNFVARALSPISDRVSQIEQKLANPLIGPKGDPGPSGNDGIDGKSVDPDELRSMVDIETARAVAAIPKPADGKDGAPGNPGKDGKDADATEIYNRLHNDLLAAVAALPVPRNGIDGKDGASVHPDTLALMVRDTVDKAVAAMPKTLAADGRDGRDGLDAAQLDPLPRIDESRSYARGTWACHNGGLIRATRATDPITDGLTNAGWAVVVEGVSAVVVTQGDDPRVISVAAMLTSGIKSEGDFRVPMMIYREVWKVGAYQPGDIVTWSGSAWHCQATTTAKPGETSDWKLMVKEGRAGKDATASGPQPRETVKLK